MIKIYERVPAAIIEYPVNNTWLLVNPKRTWGIILSQIWWRSRVEQSKVRLKRLRNNKPPKFRMQECCGVAAEEVNAIHHSGCRKRQKLGNNGLGIALDNGPLPYAPPLRRLRAGMTKSN